MNGFDKFCAGFAILLGMVLLVLGALGLFVGCNAHFTLPPVLGVLPAIAGWGIVKSVITAWRVQPGKLMRATEQELAGEIAEMMKQQPVNPQDGSGGSS